MKFYEIIGLLGIAGGFFSVLFFGSVEVIASFFFGITLGLVIAFFWLYRQKKKLAKVLNNLIYSKIIKWQPHLTKEQIRELNEKNNTQLSDGDDLPKKEEEPKRSKDSSEPPFPSLDFLQ